MVKMYGEDFVPHFAQTSNVRRWHEGIKKLENRGAAEATIMAVTGEVGLGKTRTAKWYSAQHTMPFVSIKPNASIGWVLSEICRALGQVPPQTLDLRFQLITKRLTKLNKGLICDEVEHALSDGGVVLETLRHIGQETEQPIILVGRGHIVQSLAKFDAVYSRVSAVVEYKPMIADDYDNVAMAYGLALEKGVGSKLVSLTGGRMREGMSFIKQLMDMTQRGGSNKVSLPMLDRTAAPTMESAA